MALLQPQRTTTWDRPPPLAAQRTISWGRPPSFPLAAQRTTTWDRPPLADTGGAWALLRTSTLLESSRATPNAFGQGLSLEARLLSEPAQRYPSQAHVPLSGAVPPTSLRPPPSPLAEGALAFALGRTTTWSRAPATAPVALGAWLLQGPVMLAASLRSHAPALQRTHTVNVSELPGAARFRRLSLTSFVASMPEGSVVRIPAATSLGASQDEAPSAAGPGVRQPLMRGFTVELGSLQRLRPGTARAARAGSALPGPERSLALAAARPARFEAEERSASVPRGKARPAPQAPGPGPSPEPPPSAVPPSTLVAPTREQVARCGQSLLSAAFFAVGEASPEVAVVGDHVQVNGGRLSSMPDYGVQVGQMRLVVAGLMGSGKSTLCRALRHLLGGVWVNQDEFAHKGKAAKKAFLAEVQRVANDKCIPALLVDKINTQLQHRREILEAMKGGAAPGMVVLLQLRHPADAPERWENAVNLCQDRILGRGTGHRTLKGDNPELGKILRMTANGVQPMSEDELREFRSRIELDMTLAPAELVHSALTALLAAGMLSGLSTKELFNDDRVLEALEVAQEAEQQLAEAAPALAPADWARQPKGPPPTWLWEVVFDEPSTATLQCFWDFHGKAELELKQVSDFHVTLLYLGGASDEEIASRAPHLGGAKQVAKLRDNLATCEGMAISVEIRGLVQESRIACAEVSGLGELCSNVFPHITLACAEGVPPRVSNELLARKAAAEDLQSGLGPWLTALGLAQYELALFEWCSAMGAATPDEIAENAAEAAASMESRDEEKRRFIEEVLSRSAPPGFSAEAVSPAIVLHGKLRARRQGV